MIKLVKFSIIFALLFNTGLIIFIFIFLGNKGLLNSSLILFISSIYIISLLLPTITLVYLQKALNVGRKTEALINAAYTNMLIGAFYIGLLLRYCDEKEFEEYHRIKYGCKVEKQYIKKNYCKKCGRELNNNEEYCLNCKKQ